MPVQQYLLDYQKNAFGVNAPTAVIRTITGREPEEYETITRRYAAHTPQIKRSLVTQVQLLLLTLIWMLRPGPRTAPYLALDEFSDRKHAALSADSAEWRHSHELQTNELMEEKR